MKVSDRGTKKWVSLMLPEHVTMLKDVFQESKEKPILDQQHMAEIDRKLKISLHKSVELKLTYFQNGESFTVQGMLKRIDQLQGYIVLLNEEELTLSLSDIIDVEF